MCVKLSSKRGSKTLFMVPLALAAAVSSIAQAAEVKIPDTTLTGSLRTSFTNKDTGAPKDENDFTLNSLSLYVNSKITENIKFSLSTEYNAATPGDPRMQVQDAIAQFEYGPTMNIWAGRFLAPTDRANSYGAYFANNWGFFTDGVQDGYPSTYGGRTDGVAYWGDFADTKLKLSAGLFDSPSTRSGGSGDADSTMFAARVQYDFWDAEPGYYVNGTYYGEKDILALAVATNMVGSDNTSNVDFLFEKKVGNGGAVTVEGEYIKYDGLVDSPTTDGDGYYVLGSYLFPQVVGLGKIQLLGKFGTYSNEVTGIDTDTTEANVNYIIKSFNVRTSLFYIKNSPSTGSDTTQLGLGLQLMTL